MRPADGPLDLASRLGGDEDARTVAALPDVGAAHAGGAAGQRLYAAIAAARRQAAPHQHHAIDVVLARRRAFLEPIGAAPTMFTLNGIGSRLYGAAERGHDGTCIATLFMTILFVPIVPLSSYLVRSAGGRSWNFFGRVPLSRAHRAWRWTALAAVVLVVASIAYSLYERSTHTKVRLANGLDVPVVTRFGGTTVSLAAGDVVTRDVSTGAHHVVTTLASGEAVEELDVDVPAGKDLVLYNVLGAAPVEVTAVVYSRAGTESSAPGATGEDLSGERFVVRDPVEFVFETPPSTLSLRERREVRRHAMVAEGGWKTAVASLFTRREGARGAELAIRVALVERTDEAIEMAGAAALSVDPNRALEFTTAAIAKAPESIEAHRMHQETLRRLGRRDEAREHYRAQFEKSPSSARDGYLYTRMLPNKEAIVIVERLVREHPDDRWLLRSLSWLHFEARRFADAAAAMDRLEKVDAKSAARLLSERARALVASGRTADAQRLVRPVAAAGDWPALLLYAQLARLPGASREVPEVSVLIPIDASKGVGKAGVLAVLSAGSRDGAEFARDQSAIDSREMREACRLDLLAFDDIEAAVKAQATVSAEVLSMLDEETGLTLACELLRRGDAPRAKAIWGGVAPRLQATFDFERIADPVALLAEDDIDLSVRACLELAAARRAVDQAERDRWLAAAKADDILRVVVKR